MSELLCITKKKKIQFPLWDLKLKQLYLSSSHTNNRQTLGKSDRFVTLFLSWWVCALLLAQAMASDKPPEPIHREAQMPRPYSTPESQRQLCKQELLMADLAQKWLIIKQQGKLHSDSAEASQHIVGNFFFSSLGRDQALHWMAFTSLFFAVLTIVRLLLALGSSFSSLFSERCAGNCLLSPWFVPRSQLPKNCGSLQMLWPWQFLAQTPQLCLKAVLQALPTIILLTLQLQPFNSGKASSFLKVRLRTIFKNF